MQVKKTPIASCIMTCLMSMLVTFPASCSSARQTVKSLAKTPAALQQCFSTAGPWPGTGPWHQLYRAARGSPGIYHFSFLSSFHE